MQWFTDPEQREGWQYRLADRLSPLLPSDPQARFRLKTWVFRIIAVAEILLALYYFIFRYTRSVNLEALWFSIPLLLAETYSFLGTLLFILTLWKPTVRQPPPPPRGWSVDVFITTYNEPVDLVRMTAEAALRIYYPHETYVLDDGNRLEVRAMCEEIGCKYITRGPEWEGRPRHAKAGNVNNALMHTSGDFILILDADQVPAPNFLHRTLGYFQDPRLAFVQTPQFFYNVPDDDPFGSQAPLFYGPIQQGKDGWNAAFFCGTNAILRREALMQLGVMRYVQGMEQRLLRAMSTLPLDIAAARRRVPRRYRRFAQRISQAAGQAVHELREGQRTLEEVLRTFNEVVEEVQREIVLADLRNIARDLAEIEALEQQRGQEAFEQETGVEAAKAAEVLADAAEVYEFLRQTAGEDSPAARVFSLRVIRNTRQAINQGLTTLSDELLDVAAPPMDLLGIDKETAQVLRMDTGEALDVQPLATFSVTEDMATALQLHSLGWKSLFHPEILAYGLAPEDLGSALQQRLRWAIGTIQVMLQDNPLTKPGLSWGQRLQYFMTMYSYFSGFASLIYLISPIVYLFFGISPVVSFAGEFLIRIGPYLLVNQVLYQFAAWGLDTLRGEQYNLALFPIQIQAVVTALSGRKASFRVTPKTRQEGVYLHLVLPQLTLAVLFVLGSLYALLALALGWRNDLVGVWVNIFWAIYNIFMLQVILKAALARPYSKRLPPARVMSPTLLQPRPESISLSDWRSRSLD